MKSIVLRHLSRILILPTIILFFLGAFNNPIQAQHPTFTIPLPQVELEIDIPGDWGIRTGFDNYRQILSVASTVETRNSFYQNSTIPLGEAFGTIYFVYPGETISLEQFENGVNNGFRGNISEPEEISVNGQSGYRITVESPGISVWAILSNWEYGVLTMYLYGGEDRLLSFEEEIFQLLATARALPQSDTERTHHSYVMNVEVDYDPETVLVIEELSRALSIRGEGFFSFLFLPDLGSIGISNEPQEVLDYYVTNRIFSVAASDRTLRDSELGDKTIYLGNGVTWNNNIYNVVLYLFGDGDIGLMLISEDADRSKVPNLQELLVSLRYAGGRLESSTLVLNDLDVELGSSYRLPLANYRFDYPSEEGWLVTDGLSAEQALAFEEYGLSLSQDTAFGLAMMQVTYVNYVFPSGDGDDPLGFWSIQLIPPSQLMGLLGANLSQNNELVEQALQSFVVILDRNANIQQIRLADRLGILIEGSTESGIPFTYISIPTNDGTGQYVRILSYNTLDRDIVFAIALSFRENQ